ncbi:small ribosomal subunit protein mS37-like [Porites lutea]|uniref:small ribosomal subunit protein mS37-like n=1 Tax=Porites lutea TaxID=51062 RepID=UPI003CC5D456
MVNVTSIAFARKPRLIYGVKRGKVPTKLRPHLLPSRQDDGRAPCVHEMFQLLGCWKSNAYDDAYCREEIQSFMNCVSQQMEIGRSKSSSEWTQDEVNATLKHFTPYLKRVRSN